MQRKKQNYMNWKFENCNSIKQRPVKLKCQNVYILPKAAHWVVVVKYTSHTW